MVHGQHLAIQLNTISQETPGPEEGAAIPSPSTGSTHLPIITASGKGWGGTTRDGDTPSQP